jgi:hypothetical protein
MNVNMNMNIIKNIGLDDSIKFEIDSCALFSFVEDNLLHNSSELELFIFNYISTNEKQTELLCTYIENIITDKYKKKEIEYRAKLNPYKKIQQIELVNYFTDDDIASDPDFFIDLSDRTYDIISDLYYDYINIYDIKDTSQINS